MSKENSSRRTVPFIQSCKEMKQTITALTAYDYTCARLIDEAGVDLILVGDSLGMVIQGYDTTIPVTLDEMIYHCRCVHRGVQKALLVGDLPFGSYHISVEQALTSALRLVKEGGVAAVKLEGGARMHDTIVRLVAMDIPVMGHIGMTPQSYHAMGGYKVQGKGKKYRCDSPEQVVEDAHAVEDAGAFSVVLECIPADLAQEITEQLAIPTIGIGAGSHCDGQILVLQDMLGMNLNASFKFVKRFAELGMEIQNAVQNYILEVQGGTFPSEQQSFHSDQLGLKKQMVKQMVQGRSI